MSRRNRGEGRLKRVIPLPEMGGFVEGDLAEALPSRSTPDLSTDDRKAIEVYARRFEQEPRRRVGPTLPPTYSDAACVRVYVGSRLMHGIGWRRLARLLEWSPGAANSIYRRGKLLFDRALAEGRFDDLRA
jgi:hypothetical protein